MADKKALTEFEERSQGAFVEAEVHEEPVGLAHLAAGRDAEDLHDR